jgi:hypothetical protein
MSQTDSRICYRYTCKMMVIDTLIKILNCLASHIVRSPYANGSSSLSLQCPTIVLHIHPQLTEQRDTIVLLLSSTHLSRSPAPGLSSSSRRHAPWNKHPVPPGCLQRASAFDVHDEVHKHPVDFFTCSLNPSLLLSHHLLYLHLHLEPHRRPSKSTCS